MSVDLTVLHPTLQEKIAELIKVCEKNNLKIRVTQGLRTAAEQDALYARGRTKPGNKVTNAKGGYSMHNWGVAFDFCRNDGSGAYNDSDGFFTKVGKLGVSIGLEWGGNWKSPVDKPHFQLPDWGSTTATLRQQYGTFEKFKATWKSVDPDEKYGKRMAEAKFKAIKDSYLRSTPEISKNRVRYSELSATLKKKCRNKDGYAVFKAGSTFTRIRSYTDKNGDKWKEFKSGYWFPYLYKDGKRAEKI